MSEQEKRITWKPGESTYTPPAVIKADRFTTVPAPWIKVTPPEENK